MKNKRILKGLLLLILIGLLVSSVGCNQTKKSLSSFDGPLTMEEKLEDFEYAYNLIKENYPFLEVNKRLHGVDWLANKEEYVERIKNTRTDDEFMMELSNIMRELNNGHTHVVEKEHFKWYHKAYSQDRILFENPWSKVFNEEKVLARYNYSKQEDDEEIGYFGNTNPAFETDIIVPNKVAYLKIHVMDGGRVEEDGKEIRKFYEEIKDYEKLIIDIRGNSGGSDHYWQANVISPLAKEPISVSNYLLVRGDYGNPFYRSRGIKLKPISHLDQDILKKMPEEVERNFQRYWKVTKTIKPKDPIDFRGKIYLLVDYRVYSSSESFAAFCKDSGFATLVGETTGGDGIGIDPLFFSLPNSGIVIRFSSMMALNGDFTINEEVKTTPHVKVSAVPSKDYRYDKAIQYVLNEN